MCPDLNGVGGSWVRLWGTLALRLTRQFHVVDDGAIRAVLACRTSSGHPRGLYGDPDPAAYTSTVNRLLRAYRNEHDINTYAIRHDNISGAPLELLLLQYAPSLPPDGTIEMVSRDCHLRCIRSPHPTHASSRTDGHAAAQRPPPTTGHLPSCTPTDPQLSYLLFQNFI